MSLLHVFDMDGTLLRETTASIEIARELGCLSALQKLEQQFKTSQINTHEFADGVYQLWAELTSDDVSCIFDKAPWIRGLREVFEDIRLRQEYSLVVTMSPDFFARYLEQIGADCVVASRFPSLPFKEELDASGILSPEEKVVIVEEKLFEYGLDNSSCIAYGDSSSDIPLFKTLKHTISINGDAFITPLSRHQYVGDDLREAYNLARSGWFKEA